MTLVAEVPLGLGYVAGSDTSDDTDLAWLRAPGRPNQGTGSALTAVELFAGCGGMSLGLWEATRRSGVVLDQRLAVEGNPAIADVYRTNLGGRVVVGNVARLFNGQIGEEATPRELIVADRVGALDVLLGGPPCQGHSDLNNYTRRNDPKNDLYLRMARAAEVLSPRVVVIENVPPVQWDTGKVVSATEAALRDLGYAIAGAVIDSSSAGVPQRRKRFIMLGSRVAEIDPASVLKDLASRRPEGRTVAWAIDDLEDLTPETEIDRPSKLSEENVSRIAYLSENSVQDLPNSERPKCHRDDPTHTYKSMYGRLWWDKPAQTITTGFTSMGQGRFVHPSRSRTLTPHEAARLQTFPDWFDWGDAKRTQLSTMIGNAVPPLLMVALGVAIIPTLVADGRVP